MAENKQSVTWIHEDRVAVGKLSMGGRFKTGLKVRMASVTAIRERGFASEHVRTVTCICHCGYEGCRMHTSVGGRIGDG